MLINLLKPTNLYLYYLIMLYFTINLLFNYLSHLLLITYYQLQPINYHYHYIIYLFSYKIK